jgi:hypothetical protein
MYVKVNEFETAVATPVAAPAAIVARRHPWPNAVHGLAGLAFLAAWLPVTLLCWALFGTMIVLKIGVDAGHYVGRVLSGDRGAE